MNPPFQITPKILNLVAEISLLLGRYEGLHAPIPQPRLRKQNQIRTIQASLAIEGNTLSLDQVTAILENKRVSGSKQEILEVHNAILLYQDLHEFNPVSSKDLLKAHSILMKGLNEDAGKYRRGSVGIIKGSQVSHIAPPSSRVPALMEDLFHFLKANKGLSPLIKSCVFHYEFEFIHPFLDGNGRIGRFWQHLILSKFHSAFEFLPFESLIKERQSLYYKALEHSDQAGNSTFFIEFSLSTLLDSLSEFLKDLKPPTETTETRLELAKKEFGKSVFSRKDYLQIFKTLSTATASRDLEFGVRNGILKRSDTKALARYTFV